MLSRFLSIYILGASCISWNKDAYNKMSTETIFKALLFLLYQFSLFCEHPNSGALAERKLELHRSLTLEEATEKAYEVSDMTELCTCLDYEAILLRRVKLALFPGLPYHYCRKSKTSFVYVSTVQCTLEIDSACFASRKGETGGGGWVSPSG